MLEQRLLACKKTPALHAHQIAALEHWLSLARDARDPRDFTRRLEEAGATFAVARAEWLDRYAGLERLYRTIGDEEKRRAAAICVEEVERASTGAFLEASRAARERAEPIERAAAEAEALIAPLAIAAFEARVEGDDVSRASRRAETARLWSALAGADPNRAWTRIRAHPPYRHRLPFAEGALAELGAWLDEAIASAPELPEDAPPPAPAPGSAGTASGPAPGASDPPGGFLELFASSASVHARALGQPLAERHYRAVQEALGGAGTPTEQELELARSRELFAVESAWYEVLLRIGLRPLAAAAQWEVERTEERRRTVLESERAVRLLFGKSGGELLGAPGLGDFVSRVLFEHGQTLQPAADETAFLGESGLSLVAELREAHRRRAIGDHTFESGEALEAYLAELPDERRFSTPEAMREHYAALIAEAAGADLEAPAADRGLVLWDRALRWEDLRRALRRPEEPTPW